MKIKLSSIENNVTIFAKEMSDLLDTHEINTNNDSQDIVFSINFGEETSELDKNLKINPKFFQKITQKKAINGTKENKILLSQENLLMSKKKY